MSQRLVLPLLATNLVLLALLLLQGGRVDASPTPPDVLRGRALEIVDGEGRVRASLGLVPADPAYAWPDGRRGYPETVILRLITADGKPRVKMTTSPDGSGLMLLGDSDTTQSILGATGKRATLKLRDDEQTQRTLGAEKPVR